MKINGSFRNWSLIAVALLVVFGFAACGGGGSAGGGIGGTGKAIGAITDFGSVFVNGVEFETSSSTFIVEDNPNPTEDDLAIGMRVTVNGTINADHGNDHTTGV